MGRTQQTARKSTTKRKALQKEFATNAANEADKMASNSSQVYEKMGKNSTLPDIPEDPELRETINEWAREAAEQGSSFDIEKINAEGENNLDFLQGGEFSEYFQHKVDVEKKRIEVVKRFNTFSDKSKEEADPKSLASKIFDGKAQAVYDTYAGGGISYPIRGQTISSQPQAAPFSQTPYLGQTSSRGYNNFSSQDDEPVFGKPILQNMDRVNQEAIPVFGKPLPSQNDSPVFGKQLPQSLESGQNQVFGKQLPLSMSEISYPTSGQYPVFGKQLPTSLHERAFPTSDENPMFGKQLPTSLHERAFPTSDENPMFGKQLPISLHERAFPPSDQNPVFGKEFPQSTSERSYPTTGYKSDLHQPSSAHNQPVFGEDPRNFQNHQSHAEPSLGNLQHHKEKLVDCYGEVILVMNQSGVILLEEVQQLCYFEMSSLVGINKINEGIECRVNAKLISANQRISQVPYFAASVWLEGDQVPPEILTKLMVPVDDESLREYNYVVNKVRSKLPRCSQNQDVNARTSHDDNSRFDRAQPQDKLDSRPKLSTRRSSSRENNRRRGRRSRSRSSRNPTVKQEQRSPRARIRSSRRSVSRDRSRKRKRSSSTSRRNKSRSRSRDRHSRKRPEPRSNSKDKKLKLHQRQISKSISNIQKKDEGKSKESKDRKTESKGKKEQDNKVGSKVKKTGENVCSEAFSKAIQSVERNSTFANSYSNNPNPYDQRNIHQGPYDTNYQLGQPGYNSLSQGATNQFRQAIQAILPNNPAESYGQSLTHNKDAEDQEQAPFRVLVAIDAVVMKFGFSKYFLNIGGCATINNNEMPFFGSVIPPFIKNHEDYSETAKKELMQKFNLKVGSDIEFQHPGKGHFESTSEKECLENMIDYLEGVALESNEQCVLVLHNIDCILPLLLRKLGFYKLENRFSGFVYGVADVTSLAWNFASPSQSKLYPSIRELLNLLPNNCFYEEDPNHQTDDFATMIGKYINKLILAYPHLGNQKLLFQHSALVTLEDFQKQNKQIIAKIRCTDPAKDKGKFVRQVELVQGSGRQGSSRKLNINLTASKLSAQPSFEEEGYMAIALCESQIEPDKEKPVTLKLQIFVPEGLVLVLRNPENTSSYSMLPQAVSITNSSVMTKGVKEEISSVIVKVRNDGEKVLKITKGDELGLIRIKKEKGQESAKSSKVNTTTESTENNTNKADNKSSSPVKTSHDGDLTIPNNSSGQSGSRENIEEDIKFVDGK